MQSIAEQLKSHVGKEIHVGEWFKITQDLINRFGDLTGDKQWIHVDSNRAARESPFGTTIAQGYLTLSLVPTLMQGENLLSSVFYKKSKMVLNYGLNRVRFPQAVKCLDEIRARTALIDVEEREKGLTLTRRITIEIRGREKPACVAEAVTRVIL